MNSNNKKSPDGIYGKSRIKERLAPCGLHCGKCYAFVDGDIKNYSIGLKRSLGDFDIYAQRFVDMTGEQAFRKYPEFKELLSYFANVECRGCRKERCKIFKGCQVRNCSEQKKVDFCFQCADFPCNDTGFDSHLVKRWVAINMKIKKIGVEKYYQEVKDKPRY
ncbi:MAG: DUF3795 domain-containing protein [Candidatus Aminicenantes bacterium]